MKNQKLFCSIFLFFVLFSLSGKANVLMVDGSIVLKGKYGPPRPTKSLPVDVHPFTAELVGNASIYIYADLPVADVTVTILKDGEIIDAYLLSFDGMNGEIVSLVGYESGEYSLVLTNAFGLYLQGSFSL